MRNAVRSPIKKIIISDLFVSNNSNAFLDLMCICLSSSTSPQMTLSFVGNKNVFKDHVGMDTFASYAIDELRDLWNDCRQEC